MNKITESYVKEQFESLVNEGRATQIKLSAHTTPLQAIERVNADDISRISNRIGLYGSVAINDFYAKASFVWNSLFWKIGEQILIVGEFNTPFAKMYQDVEVGGLIEEIALRMKEPLDRNALPNSALFTNYITQRDSILHAINQMKVFATTYNQVEITRVSQTWSAVTAHLNAELENLIKSASNYLHKLSKNALATSYLAGALDTISVPLPTTETNARQALKTISNTMSNMVIEPNTKYIPLNNNAANSVDIEDIATSNLVLVVSAEFFESAYFESAVNIHFDKLGIGDKISKNIVVVGDFPTAISPDIQIANGYTPVAAPKKILGFIAEQNAFIFRQHLHGKFQFDNAATLNTSIFYHLDALASISDRRKIVAITEQ